MLEACGLAHVGVRVDTDGQVWATLVAICADSPSHEVTLTPSLPMGRLEGRRLVPSSNPFGEVTKLTGQCSGHQSPLTLRLVALNPDEFERHFQTALATYQATAGAAAPDDHVHPYH